MSVSARLRYQYLSFTQFIFNFELPAFLTGTLARVTILSVIVVMVIGYVVQVSNLTTGGFQIADLEKQVDSLSDETQKINAEVATYQSIHSVEKRLEGISMVPAGQIHYVKTADAAMAKR